MQYLANWQRVMTSNLSLNPDPQRKAAASRHGLRTC
jgi:hypothetical protein